MTHLSKAKRAMTKLTATQSLILTAGAQRAGNIAMPLPKGLAGAAAKMAVTRMIDLGWLQEVDAIIQRREPLWRETGDGHGTTLIVTEVGLVAIGIEQTVVPTMSAICEHIKVESEAKPPIQRPGTKQALLIAMLKAPDGASMEEIIAATQWQTHTARGAMSGALKKKRGLVVTSAKEEGRGRVYRII